MILVQPSFHIEKFHNPVFFIQKEKSHQNSKLFVADLPSEVSIAGPDSFQAAIENVLKCKTDESYPAVKLLWRVDGILVEEGVTSSIEYTGSGAMEAWSSLALTVDDDDSSKEVTVTCEVEGQETKLSHKTTYKIQCR